MKGRNVVENEDGLQTNPALNVSIEKMVYGGEGLARTQEGVLLVPLVLPGERVAVQPEDRSKGVRRARLLQVAEPSADRVSARCPYFGHCGGCQYQHIGYNRQLQIKQEILRECFERIGKIRIEVPISVIASEPWQYRNRTRLRIHKERQSFQIGYFELLSHHLCPIDHCPISSPLINDVISKLAGGLGADSFPDGSAEIEVLASDSGQSLLATVYSAEPAPHAFGDVIRNALPAITSVCWRQEAAGRQAGRPRKAAAVWGSGYIVYHVGEFHYRVGHESFFQTNRFLLQELIGAAVADLDGQRALDLYAGVGLFTLPLARRFENVAAVEADASAARDLVSNIGVVSGRARAYRLTAEKFVATALPNWDVIVTDPPRNGLGKIVRENLCRLRPRRLVYISCDPTTLARDIAAFSGCGYRIRSVHLADLFPQTFHMESVVHMERLE